MFGAIGTFVYRLRFAVIGVLIALMAGLGLYGLGLGKHLSQSGWFDPTSESVKGSQIADTAMGRDHKSDVILLITPPEGTKVDDAEFGAKVENFIDDLIAKHPNQVNRDNPGIIDPFFSGGNNQAAQAARNIIRERTFTADKSHAFISIGVKGDNDTEVLNNYKAIEPSFDDISERFDLPGTDFELAGLQPVAGSMADGMDKDIQRAEVIALPLVAIMLFFIFGGVVAACLPVLIGGLTIAGSLGIMTILAQITELNIFAQSVVTLIGLGIAIDYGLFIVSRFREELAEGYSTKAAVRRTVMTAGQTVVFSATIIVAALACLLIMPQGFLKSVAYGAIASVSLAALLSITVLPAILSILGPRIDALGFKFLSRTKTKQEIEDGFWGRLAGWVMKHPVATAVPTTLLLLLLMIPFGSIKFGGISEAYLPPDNPNRIAQENFDKFFPTERTEEIKLVVAYDPNTDAEKLVAIADQANKIPGFTKKFNPNSDQGGQYGENGPQIIQMSAGLVDRNTAGAAISDLRAIDTQGLSMWVAGTPALTQDSIDALLSRLPLMAILLVLVTGFLMFLAFGSLVLPIKAALMSALGLGATLGILTWIFVDGHGAELANFTPGPLFAAVLVLIIAIIFGLSTDYEIFLLSRMVEARQKGASTTEAIRVGTAHTGRIITAAAAILVVVTGAFGMSEIVMMKYIAYGMIAALILDATIIRMLLVPSVMKLLGDDCWWAPRWMRVMQQKIGLGETVLDDEPDEMRDSSSTKRVRSAGTLVAEAPTGVMTVPSVPTTGQPVTTGSARPGPARPVPARNAPPTQKTPARTAPDSNPQPRVPANRPAPQQVRRPQPAPQPSASQSSAPQSGPQRQPARQPSAPQSGPQRQPAPPRQPAPQPKSEPQQPAAQQPPAQQPTAPAASPTGKTRQPARPTTVRSGPSAPPSGPVSTADGTKSSGSSKKRGSRDRNGTRRPDTGAWRLGEGGIRLGGATASRPPAEQPPTQPTASANPGSSNGARSNGVASNGVPSNSAPANAGPSKPAPSNAGPSTPRPTPPRPIPPGSTPPRATPPRPTAAGPAAPRSTPHGVTPNSGAFESPLRRRPELDGNGKRPLAASLSPEGQRAPRREPVPPEESPMSRGLSEGIDDPVQNNQAQTPSSARSADRHARADDDSKQISVQELLRRSRSER